MIRAGAGLLFTLVLLVVTAWAVVSALSWRQEVAMFPVFAGGVTLVLLVMELIRQVVAGGFFGTSKKIVKPEQERREGGDWVAPLWFFGFVGIVLLIGIPVGLPLMLFLMARYAFGETWVVSISTAAAIGVIALLVFDGLFGVIWPRAMVLDWIWPL